MKYSRILCTVLLILMLGTLISCNAAQTSGSSKPDQPAASVPTPDGQISVKELSELQIVYPFGKGDAYPTAAKQIAAAISEEYGITVKVTPESYGKEAACEIVLGVCPTREVSAGSTVTRRDDYYWRIDGKKILMAAGSDGAWEALANRFVNSVVNKGDGKLFFDGAVQEFTFLAEYVANTISLGNADLLDCVIVYPRIHRLYEMESAEMIAKHLSDMSGYKVSAVSETAKHSASSEIHVGFTARVAELYTQTIENDAYSVLETDFGAMLVAGTGYGYYAMAKDLCERLTVASANGKNVTVTPDYTGEGTGEKLRVMSFNVHYIDDELGYINPDRVPNVIATVWRANADVIGFQEVTPEWKAYLLQYLGNEYAFVGEGRDGGASGEHSAIMYRKDKFTLLESDTLWLSKTPESVSRFPESSLNRIVTYAKLQRNSDGQIFVHMNTHLDHKSEEARNKQTDVLLNIAERFKGTPVFMTGDFNTTSKSQVYVDIQSDGNRDSAKFAFVVNEAPTSPSSGSVIDFCFATDKYVLATEYYVDTTKYGEKDPSDHCPVIVEFVFK